MAQPMVEGDLLGNVNDDQGSLKKETTSMNHFKNYLTYKSNEEPEKFVWQEYIVTMFTSLNVEWIFGYFAMYLVMVVKIKTPKSTGT
jgi:hypothetical protein